MRITPLRVSRITPPAGWRELIRNAACWAVALSLPMALSTTESEAQPRRDHQREEARRRLEAGESARTIAESFRVHHAKVLGAL